ncbi:MAG: peroxiredoxin [Egibacteraceae bacterium]
MSVRVGDIAPDFTLTDQHGKEWSLAEQRGHPVVLYFYPKDSTPGCTAQACDVRDHWADFEAVGAAVAGISPDGVGSHAGFASAHGLPHTLLADPDREAISAYDAWGTKSMYGRAYEGVIRSSVVIDEDGRVLAVFDKIQPKQQSAKALKALRDR